MGIWPFWNALAHCHFEPATNSSRFCELTNRTFEPFALSIKLAETGIDEGTQTRQAVRSTRQGLVVRAFSTAFIPSTWVWAGSLLMNFGRARRARTTNPVLRLPDGTRTTSAPSLFT